MIVIYYRDTSHYRSALPYSRLHIHCLGPIPTSIMSVNSLKNTEEKCKMGMYITTTHNIRSSVAAMLESLNWITVREHCKVQDCLM